MKESYCSQYLKFEEVLIKAFEELVRKGAEFPTFCDVRYVHGKSSDGLNIDMEGRSWFLATKLIPDPNYNLNEPVGEKDLVVEYNKVTFIDVDGNRHHLEPDLYDLRWCAEILDAAAGYYWENGKQLRC